MKAYSEDLRQKVVEALARGTNKSQAAHLFGVSLSSVKRYAKMAGEGTTLAPRKAPGKRSKIGEHGRRLLHADLKERLAATLPERCKFLERVLGVKVSESTICRLLKRLGWSRKKGLRVLRPWLSRRLARSV
jgi:transposase